MAKLLRAQDAVENGNCRKIRDGLQANQQFSYNAILVCIADLKEYAQAIRACQNDPRVELRLKDEFNDQGLVFSASYAMLLDIIKSFMDGIAPDMPTSPQTVVQSPEGDISIDTLQVGKQTPLGAKFITLIDTIYAEHG